MFILFHQNQLYNMKLFKNFCFYCQRKSPKFYRKFFLPPPSYRSKWKPFIFFYFTISNSRCSLFCVRFHFLYLHPFFIYLSDFYNLFIGYFFTASLMTPFQVFLITTLFHFIGRHLDNYVSNELG